ncbi:Vacuolar protease A [Mortierella sp. GBA30]|nr:Vacuolar protease A [Mortierella sp. GBA30]
MTRSQLHRKGIWECQPCSPSSSPFTIPKQLHPPPQSFRPFLSISIILITLTCLVVRSHAATFEVLVNKPEPRPRPDSSDAPLGSGKLTSSKYIGNTIVTNSKNLGYAGTIMLGNNPPQSFEVVFDTGSDMIVVTSNECQGTHCNDMDHYTCTSCAKTPWSYNISYGDGTWGNGPIVEDTVSIGGLVVQDQQILDIVKSGLDLSSYGPGIAGLVGLMPSSSVPNMVPPLATIFNQKLLDMNVFSVYLASTLQPSQGGSFLFGGIDKSKFVGELNYLPLSTAAGVREGMWYIDAEEAFVGDEPVDGYIESPWLFDTGTSFIAVPDSFAQEFHSQIPGSEYSEADQYYTVPCTGDQSFGLKFNGTTYEIPYLDYIARASGPSSLCVSLVMPLRNFGMHILGDPFLRQVYTVYDFTPGASRIGLAKANVSNASLGNEGLSGDPVPGGTVISPVDSVRPMSMGQSRFAGAKLGSISVSMTLSLAVIATLFI